MDEKKKDTYKISRKTGSTASEIYGKIEKDYNFLKFLGATSGVYKSYLEPEEIRKLIQSEVLRRDHRTKPNSEEDGRTYANILDMILTEIATAAATTADEP